jgi:hypothetical protein
MKLAGLTSEDNLRQMGSADESKGGTRAKRSNNDANT